MSNQPDPAFTAFFSGDYKARDTSFWRMVDRVVIPGAAGASWDRRAAYLLWALGQLYDAAMPGRWETDLAAWLDSQATLTPASPPVGTGINHVPATACAPSDWGIKLPFNSITYPASRQAML